MNTYQFMDGYTFQANAAEGIVNALINSSLFAGDDTQTEFMAGMAKRILAFSGVKIRSDSAENFVEDLLLNNLLIQIS